MVEVDKRYLNCLERSVRCYPVTGNTSHFLLLPCHASCEHRIARPGKAANRRARSTPESSCRVERKAQSALRMGK